MTATKTTNGVALFEAVKSGHNSVLEIGFKILSDYNTIADSCEMEEKEILPFIMTRLYRQCNKDKQLAEDHSATSGVPIRIIAEGASHVFGDDQLKWFKPIMKKAYKEEFEEALKDSYFQRVTKEQKAKAKEDKKPSFAKIARSVEGNIAKVEMIRGSKDKAEALAAAKLLVKALS
mgnify:CR=1 FL=1